MKSLEVLSDADTIKTLFEPTRSKIVFRYLVNGSMTVKQLADVLDKNPGTILHHIEKLKKVGLVVEERTETTVTGIVQRYYRATAREYRLGLGRMMQTDNGVSKFAQNRLSTMIRSLIAFGIVIEEQELDTAIQLLRELIEQENTVITDLPIIDSQAYNKLPGPVRIDAARIMRRYALDRDPRYQQLKEKWDKFLKSHQK
jgi:predicted ArsR family transcriptional regulator